MRGLVWLLFSVALAAGCRRHPVVESNGIKVYERFWEEAKSSVTARARIDLACPAVRATLVAKQGRYPTEVSVDGCGRRALYQRILRKHFGKNTTKNTVWQAVAVSAMEAGTPPTYMPSAQAFDDEVPPSHE